jgi:hypothetical protein
MQRGRQLRLQYRVHRSKLQHVRSELFRIPWVQVLLGGYNLQRQGDLRWLRRLRVRSGVHRCDLQHVCDELLWLPSLQVLFGCGYLQWQRYL